MLLSLPFARRSRRVRATVLLTVAAVGAGVVSGCAGAPTVQPPSDPSGALVDSLPEPERDLSRVRFYLSVGDAQAALDAYEEALATQPEAARTQVLLGRLHLLAGNPEEARRQLQAVLDDRFALEPSDAAEAHYGLALVAALVGERQQQREHLQATVALNATHADALAGLGELQAAAGELEAADRSFSRALEADPTNLVAVLGTADVAMRQEQPEVALSAYDRASELRPDYAFTYVDRAGARRELGDTDGAIADLNRAIELEPTYYWHYIDRGRLLLEAGELDAARADFTRASEIDPAPFVAHAYRATLAFQRGDRRQALASFEQVMRRRPDYYRAYPYLGILHLSGADPAAAADYFARAAERDDREPAYGLLTALSLLFAHEQPPAHVDTLLLEVMRSVPRDSWYFDVARLLRERRGTTRLATKYRSFANRTIAARVSFYLGAVELLAGHHATATLYFMEVYERVESDFVERRLAQFLADDLQTAPDSGDGG